MSSSILPMIQGSTARGDVLSRRWTCKCHGISNYHMENIHSRRISNYRVAPGHLTFSSTDTDNNFSYWEPYFLLFSELFVGYVAQYLLLRTSLDSLFHFSLIYVWLHGVDCCFVAYFSGFLLFFVCHGCQVEV